MRSALSLAPLITLGLATVLSAQTVQTLPKGYLTTNGTRANNWPWNNKSATGHRCMWIYDSSHFTTTGPILIQKLRWRTDVAYSSWAGGIHPNVTINLSTCPLDFKSASSTYANNHGKDVTAVYQGNVTVTGSTHKNGRWYVELNLTTPFRYDPTKGDLTIDYIRPTGAVTGTMAPVDTIGDSVTTWTTKTNRIQSYNTATSATGSVGPYAAIVEVTWVPANGLYSDFGADKTSGPGPLTVQFKDKSFTSSTGGVKSWAWDFDGDNKTDSTQQNPQWTFPKTTWDRQWDVSLSTTDGVHPASKITKKGFITVDPSDALATNFGSGSANKSFPSPIGLPAQSSFYSSTAGIRGFGFVAPAAFVINGFEAPNDWTPKEAQQTVTCYVLPAAPPSTYIAKAADVVFHATGPANSVLKTPTPIVITKGKWVGVLGACHGSSKGANFRNSRGSGPFTSSVLGHPITLDRLWMNADTRINMGVGTINQGGGDLTRVHVHVIGNAIVPTLTSMGVPSLGTTAKLDLQAKIAGAQGGIILLGAGRLPASAPTPFGNLLIQLPFYGSYFVPGGTGQLPVAVPLDNNLKGVLLDFQGLVYDLTSRTYGMTSGLEWFLGR